MAQNRLVRNLLILCAPVFALLSIITPWRKNAVVFVTTPQNGLTGNFYALLHYALTQTKHKVIVLDSAQCTDDVHWGPNPPTIIQPGGFAEILLRLRHNKYVITHGHKMLRKHFALIQGVKIYNVWHGIPIKGMGNLDEKFDRSDRRQLRSESARLSAFFVSSEMERSFIAGCFLLPLKNIIITGMPRMDWMTCTVDALPHSLQQQSRQLDAELSEQKLVLYAPTFRDYDRNALGFDRDTLMQFARALSQHNAVLGIRPHPRDAKLYQQIMHGVDNVIDCSSIHYQEAAVLLRKADVLISDYSSIWIDYLVTGKAVVGYLWDAEQYSSARGSMVNLDAVFPGPIIPDAENLIAACSDGTLFKPSQSRLSMSKKIFYRHAASGNCARVWAHIESH
ncbi:MAG: CDP-glycerol glycerophosphotransferase family protein [Alcanivoracaceae bacterium]|nr:CDP-glycerol glycerophosphotransferase family protein [Alcanivoracaceae bacterium]